MRHVHPVGLILTGMGHAGGFLELHDEDILPRSAIGDAPAVVTETRTETLGKYALGNHVPS